MHRSVTTLWCKLQAAEARTHLNLTCCLQIAQALQQAVQRAYYDAMQHLHTALMNVCTDFEGESYSRVSEEKAASWTCDCHA